MTPYPDDDSCPDCGQANNTGRSCSPCDVMCIYHDIAHSPDEECKHCELWDIIEELDEEALDFLIERAEERRKINAAQTLA